MITEAADREVTNVIFGHAGKNASKRENPYTSQRVRYCARVAMVDGWEKSHRHGWVWVVVIEEALPSALVIRPEAPH